MDAVVDHDNNDYHYYEQMIRKYEKSLNDILKNQLPTASTSDELISISKSLESLKFECKDELTSIINTVMIPNYENFLRNIELQKTSIGLNYSKFQQNEKTELLKQKNENLDHLKGIILTSKKQDEQISLVRNYIKCLYFIKPVIVKLNSNITTLLKNLNLKYTFLGYFENIEEINTELILSEFELIFKTCESYSLLDIEVKKVFPELEKFDILNTSFANKILPCIEIPDEPINIVKNTFRFLLALTKKLFIESSKNLEKGKKSFTKNKIEFKYSEILDHALKSFPLLNENQTGVDQYTKYIQSIISDASRDIITTQSKSDNIHGSLFQLLKVTSAIINTHLEILKNYYSDKSWLMKVMEGILVELDVQSSLIIDMSLDSLIKEKTGMQIDLMDLKYEDFGGNDYNLESFINKLFEIIGVWNMFEKFFCLKYNSFSSNAQQRQIVDKPVCLSNCQVNKKIYQLHQHDNFINILKQNVTMSLNIIFKMENIPDINRYINSFERVDLEQDQEDYPVSSIIDDFSIVFKKFLILFINAGNFQFFESFLQNICFPHFINSGFIKQMLNKIGDMSIVTTDLKQYLSKEKLAELQNTLNSTNSNEQQPSNENKSIFNIQQYTQTIFQQQQQAVKLGKNFINNATQQNKGFVISNEVTDDLNMKNLHLLLIYLNTIASVKGVLQQLLMDELLEPEYNSQENLTSTIISSTFVFNDNAELLSNKITFIMERSNEYIGKIIDNYAEKIFQIGILNNLYDFSLNILNSSSKIPIDLNKDSNNKLELPLISDIGVNAHGFNFRYVCNPSDLTNLQEISDFIKKLEYLLQPYENVMLPNIYYKLKKNICMVMDEIISQKILHLTKINALGVIKLEKELDFVIKNLSTDNKRDLVDYSLRLQFDKSRQILEILNFDIKLDFLQVPDQNNIATYKLKEDLVKSIECSLTPNEINRLVYMRV
ncbi:hypothetical protein FOG50_00529 [Hanseniaspora uvarum]|nr:hypothetical protein FOG50_00529 [Hanseniaspora uvarum]